MIDLNEELAACSWTGLLAAATENVVTEFEIEFCDSLHKKLARLSDSARLTDAQFHKLTCIAQAGGFWERER